MYCVLGENGETFLVVICRIVHRLLLREYELFVNIIHARLIKSLFLFYFSSTGVKRSSVSPVVEGSALVERSAVCISIGLFLLCEVRLFIELLLIGSNTESLLFHSLQEA